MMGQYFRAEFNDFAGILRQDGENSLSQPGNGSLLILNKSQGKEMILFESISFSC
jgi:hypothetical protein